MRGNTPKSDFPDGVGSDRIIFKSVDVKKAKIGQEKDDNRNRIRKLVHPNIRKIIGWFCYEKFLE